MSQSHYSVLPQSSPSGQDRHEPVPHAAGRGAAAVELGDVTKRCGRGRGAVTAPDRVSLSFPAGSFTARNPGPLLVALAAWLATPGVRAAAGLTPVGIEAADPDLDQDYGEAVARGPLGQVLDLRVTSGSLTAALVPGQIAVSALEASSGAMSVRVGSRVTVWLPDGTPYRATVSAVYARSLAVGGMLIPAAVAAGHTGTHPGYAEILVSGGSASDLARIVAAHPGLRGESPSVYNAQSAQTNFGNNLLLGLIATLAAVALVNTLVMATLGQRSLVTLLGRIGAARGQVAAVFAWQALFVAVTGTVAGIAAGLATLLVVTRAVTGSWVPYIAPGSAAALIAVVLALTAGATLIPFRAMARTGPSLT